MQTESQNQLIKVDPTEFGIEASNANFILEKFQPLQVKMAELEEEYQEVVGLSQEDPMTELKAKELKKKYTKIRTARATIHKEEKAFFLNAGRFVDRIKNDADKSTIEHETKLEEIERFHANIEIERVKTLANGRIEKLKAFNFDGSAMNLGTMDENIWLNFLSGTELAFKAKEAEDKRIEAEKLAAEKAAAIEQERVSEENKALKLAAEAKEKELTAERKKQAEILEEIELKAKAEKVAAEAIRLLEQEKADKMLEDQRKQAEAKLKIERQAKEKLEAELKDKQIAEEKAEAEKQAEIKALQVAEAKAKKAPDKIKIKTIIDGLPKMECAVTSDEGEVVFNQIRAKYAGFIDWAHSQINTL